MTTAISKNEISWYISINIENIYLTAGLQFRPNPSTCQQIIFRLWGIRFWNLEAVSQCCFHPQQSAEAISTAGQSLMGGVGNGVKNTGEEDIEDIEEIDEIFDEVLHPNPNPNPDSAPFW